MNHWWFLGHSWLLQLKNHGKAINKSRISFSRLFCVLVVKGRGSGEMMSPHSLHRRTPNTATARPLCCVWSRKLTGLWNQTAAIWSPHVTSLTLGWNSYWATKLRKRSPPACEQDNDNHCWLKKHTKRTFWGWFSSIWFERKTGLKEENPSMAKVNETRAGSVSVKASSLQNTHSPTDSSPSVAHWAPQLQQRWEIDCSRANRICMKIYIYIFF